MTIDGDAAYQVLLAHDARFDGRLFVGVTSTRVYCRPICRVRMPARRNCRFFATPAQAEAASFRPCLKCRPEIAPGPGLAWTVMDASRTLARQAALALDRMLASGDETSVATIAKRLGVSDRHLRRIFLAEHGVTPLRYLQTRRLLLAKQLLTDTRIAVADVALSSGFRSVRRFNAAFLAGYRMSPSRLRRAKPRSQPAARRGGGETIGSDATGEARLAVELAYRAPLDVEALLAFISARAIPGVETTSGPAIRRTVRAGAIGVDAGWLEARFDSSASRIRLAFAPSLAPSSGTLIAVVRRWLDLDADPETIEATLVGLPGRAGLRVPGSVDPFELAVRAVLGQQVTVAAARTLAARLVARFGVTLATPWSDVDRVFPGPTVLGAAPLERIAELGIIRSRATAIGELGRRWDEIAPLVSIGADSQALVDRLKALPGIGDWTAHYIAMRALGWPDAFPPGDIAALKAMTRLFRTASHREAVAHAQAWRPWRAYALLRLWASLGAKT